MISVHVVRDDNRHLYSELLDQQHRLRYEIFCRELSWKDMKVRDGREFDQFDTPSTVYLLVTDEDELIGGCRMHPSTEPTLLSDVFPELADVRGFERAPDVMEMTRGYVVRARREDRPCRAAGAWKAAVLEYSLHEGIRACNGVWGAYLVPRLMTLGWNPRFLGLPMRIDGFDLVAASIEVSEEMLVRTWEHYGFRGPVTVWRGIGPRPDGDARLPVSA